MKPLEDMGRFKVVAFDPPWDIKFGGHKCREDNRNERLPEGGWWPA